MQADRLPRALLLTVAFEGHGGGGGAAGSGSHTKPASTEHCAEQPSSASFPPSSHCSSGSTNPSPHAAIHRLHWTAAKDPGSQTHPTVHVPTLPASAPPNKLLLSLHIIHVGRPPLPHGSGDSALLGAIPVPFVVTRQYTQMALSRTSATVGRPASEAKTPTATFTGIWIGGITS